MSRRGFRGIELSVWAVWLGSLWFMAILVAPGLFKWLPRPEAGLVAGRLFYMLSWFSVFVCTLLLSMSAYLSCMRACAKANLILSVLLAISVIELVWLHPTMSHMRQAMSVAPPELVESLRTQFGHMHVVSSVLYAVKMIGGMAWGLKRFTVKELLTPQSN